MSNYALSMTAIVIQRYQQTIALWIFTWTCMMSIAIDNIYMHETQSVVGLLVVGSNQKFQ